jgi:hypothetical protein
MKENNNVITGDKSITNTFTKDYDVISSSTKLSLLDKAIIRTILSFQSQGLICTMSNETLSQRIGESVDSIKKAITKLNKSTFFKSESKPKNNTGEWKAGKEMEIDEQKLFDFLGSNEVLPKLNKPSNSKKEAQEITNNLNVEIESEKEILLNESNDDIIKLEVDIVPDFDKNSFTLTPPTQEQLESISDVGTLEMSSPTIEEPNYINEILNLIQVNKDRIELLGQSDTVKLKQICGSGVAKKFDVTIFTKKIEQINVTI